MNHLDNLLFIDEASQKGFCSEECIEDFYFPLIKHFELIEHSLRKKHNLLGEIGAGTIIDPEIIEEVLKGPSEIFRHSNELNENFYNFIKHYPNYTIVVVSSVYRKEASFVFLTLRTNSQALINEFRYGEAITDWAVPIEVELEPEIESHEEKDHDMDDMDEDEDMVFIQLLESKKSKILADVLMNRRDDDIPFEDYSGYEFCFQETLDFPDEVFEKKDNEGDVVFTYIKTFLKGQRGEESFFYIVTCLKHTTDSTNVNVYPILALPTTDVKMCQEFRGGTRLAAPLKN